MGDRLRQAGLAIAIALSLGAAGAATGCAPAEGRHYRRHQSTVLQPSGHQATATSETRRAARRPVDAAIVR